MGSAFILLMICVMILCVILIFLILSQNPKGGGLSSTFGGGGTQMFGVQNTNNFMDKATWTVAIAIVVIVMFSGIMIADPGVITSDDVAPTNEQTEAPAGNTETKPTTETATPSAE